MQTLCVSREVVNLRIVKTGRSHKLPLLEQLFLTLRLGLFEFNLANRFGISQTSVSWINLLLKGLEHYPPWHIVKKYMPESLKERS